jgi:hypothetical protein
VHDLQRLIETQAKDQRYEKGKMATKELQALRHRCKAAYTAYLVPVQALSDAR